MCLNYFSSIEFTYIIFHTEGFFYSFLSTFKTNKENRIATITWSTGLGNWKII